eukprot:6048294-Pyramimonas_sp.AAC.1
MAANVFGPHWQVHGGSIWNSEALGRSGGQLRGLGNVRKGRVKSVSNAARNGFASNMAHRG